MSLSIFWLKIPPPIRNMHIEANPNEFRNKAILMPIKSADVGGKLNVKTMFPIQANKIPNKIPAHIKFFENTNPNSPSPGLPFTILSFTSNTLITPMVYIHFFFYDAGNFLINFCLTGASAF